MELLIKLYEGKNSRIGIVYTYKFQAVKPYEDLIREHPGESFSITIELARQKMNLTLQSDQNGLKVLYKELSYKMSLLPKLNTLIERKLPVEFVHVYFEGNTPFVAKPFHKEQFIRINNIEIIG